MKAVLFFEYGAPGVLKISEIDLPEILDDELLIKVSCAAVNPKDCFIRKGKFKLFTGRKFPQTIGNDFAGEVVRTGKSVKNFQVGDRVYGMLNGWCSGAYAEFVAAKSTEIAHQPKLLSVEEAAATPLAALTALQALRDLGKIKPGSRICINGASGGVGTFAIQIARAFGGVVTAICSFRNIEFCKQLGADHTIDYTKTDIVDTGNQFDIFFDVFGNYSFSKVRKRLTPKGVYISTIPNIRNFFDHYRTKFSFGKTARVVIVNANSEDLNILAELIDTGKVKPVIDKIYPLEKAAEAHEYIQTKRARGKVLLAV